MAYRVLVIYAVNLLKFFSSLATVTLEDCRDSFESTPTESYQCQNIIQVLEIIFEQEI